MALILSTTFLYRRFGDTFPHAPRPEGDFLFSSFPHPHLIFYFREPLPRPPLPVASFLLSTFSGLSRGSRATPLSFLVFLILIHLLSYSSTSKIFHSSRRWRRVGPSPAEVSFVVAWRRFGVVWRRRHTASSPPGNSPSQLHRAALGAFVDLSSSSSVSSSLPHPSLSLPIFPCAS